MNQLTQNAKEVLTTIAFILGEPGDFYSQQIAKDGGPTDRGLKAHTLPALCARGYVTFWTESRKTGHFTLTDAGFEEAMRLTGGRGLL